MSKHIFVVDDEESILDAMSFLLQEEGYTVSVSAKGSVLLTMSKNIPDLILLDILLSGEDGRDIVKQLKNSLRTKNIPVIMFSAHPNAQESALLSGADAFIAKPFDMDILLKTIYSILK